MWGNTLGFSAQQLAAAVIAQIRTAAFIDSLSSAPTAHSYVNT